MIKHFTSHETSLKLKELGMNQDTLFYWGQNCNTIARYENGKVEIILEPTSDFFILYRNEIGTDEASNFVVSCSAYLASELKDISAEELGKAIIQELNK